MKSKIMFIFMIILFCFMAQISNLAGIASADGCGVNPLGDTSGDSDFYVSKNQNLPAASLSSMAVSSSEKAVVPLGSSADQLSRNISADSLTPDRASPQEAGLSIVWTVEATNPDNESILYNFLQMGPATNGELLNKTGWIEENTWTWNTTDADIGQNQIQVQVKRSGMEPAEDSITQNYTISAPSAASAASSGESKDASGSTNAVDGASASTGASTASGEIIAHPRQKTADTVVGGDAFEDTDSAVESGSHPRQKTAGFDVGKPRIAPDERASAAASGGLSAISSDEDEGTSADGATASGSEDEPEIMDVGGKWSVELIDSGHTMDITLIQTGESISGIGSLIENNAKIPQTLKGSVSSNTITLKSRAVMDEYVNDVDKSVTLYLSRVDRTVSGSYELYSGEDLMRKGNATASRFTN